uniref:Putative dna-dependent protein n=1 Tax=Ixodes ricinus TaxID=34613 RepID=A0A090XB24_IXORI
MGASQSQLTREELRDYTELTYLSKERDHICLQTLQGHSRRDQVNSDKEIRLPIRDVEILPEFSSNPFRDRLLRTFSSLKDDRPSPEDFLDLLSVLSEAAPIDVKMEYAFQVFDFNDDGELCEEDLAELIHRLTWLHDKKLETQEVQLLIENVLREAEPGTKIGRLSLLEFQHCIRARTPDFESCFRLRL